MAKSDGVRAGDGFVFRSPLLPMTAFLDWAAAPDPRRYLQGLLELPEVREALFVASPSLYGALDAWTAAPMSAAGQRAEHSLVKYISRMMGRATPFGLFSGVSTGKLGRETKLALAPRAEYRRRTRLDNDYLFVLIDELLKQPEVRAKLRYRPNTSIYRSAGRLRYAGANLAGAERSYHLIAVESTPHLEDTLDRAAAGARIDELALPLVDDEATEEDARGFVGELIDAHLIVPELGVHVTGPEPVDGVIEQLRVAGIDQPRAILENVRSRIAEIDASGVGNPIDRYHAIAAALEPLPAKVEMSRLFQVDMVKPASATLATRVAADMATTIAQLQKIGVVRDSFEDWKRQFRERWEDRRVPLAEVLDEESGIGFESARGPGAEGSPLLAGIGFPGGAAENRVRWSAFEHHLLGKLATALATGADEIALDDADLEAMKSPAPATLPEAFAVMARLAQHGDELSILFEGVSGPSGGRLLGRFCHASAEIDAIVRAHHVLEEALHPEAVFAEIVHLNEGRIGNILCRPVLRAHEVVYLGVSGAPEDKQLRIDDLLVAVEGSRIVLRSQRLGREVIPRLTTAHNYRLRSLAVYRFLCALANQNTDGVGWTWGALGNAPFLPRVRIGRAIVHRATWRLDKRDLDPITAAARAAAKQPGKHAEVAAAVAALRVARKLPRMFAIAAADNELPIDLDNPLSVAAFADEVAGTASTELTELFPAVDQLLTHGPEGAFANEVVLTFTRPPPKSPAPVARPAPVTQIRREFQPGSEWLFAKIYCGEATTDRVLRDAIAPVVRAAIASGDAREWFFIRYSDPDTHLRLRLRGDPARVLGVLNELEKALQPLTAAGAVRKVLLDTYVRETERYGGDRGIELVEQLFWRDSDAVLEIIELLEGDAGATARWKLCLRGIDSLLEAVGLTAEQRAKCVGDGRDMLGREFRADPAFWSRVGDKFTRERADLEAMFDRDPVRDEAHEYQPGFAALARRDAAIAEIGKELQRRDAAGELAPRVTELAWSLVHMHANRLLHASQRAQEMLLYDFLRRLHAARKARKK